MAVMINKRRYRQVAGIYPFQILQWGAKIMPIFRVAESIYLCINLINRRRYAHYWLQ